MDAGNTLMPAIHKNLRAVADLIVNGGLANVVWVGDSTGSDSNSPRWPQGIRRRWPVQWIGKFVPCDTEAPEEVGQVFKTATITKVASGATLSDGVTVNPLAVSMGDRSFASDHAAFSFHTRHVLTNMQSHGSDVPGGSPFPSNWAFNNSLVAKYAVLIPDDPGPDAMEYCHFVTQIGGVENGAGQVLTLNTESAGILAVEETFDSGLESTDEYEALSKTFWGVDETGRFYYQAGVLFFVNAVTGFQFQTFSTGGWSATDHLSPLNSGGDAAYYDADGKYTQAQLVATLQFLRSPNIAFIQIGINRAVGEGGGGDAELTVHKGYVEKIALRYRAAMLAAGAADPQIVLVCHWQVDNDDAASQGWANGKNAKYQELIALYPWLAMVDLQAALLAEDGTFTEWNATYLSDTFHQTEAGVLRFAEIMWEAFEDALGSNSFRGRGLIGNTFRNRSIGRL